MTGASSGIGRSVAIEASRHGAKIALVARSRERLDDALQILEGDGHVALACDLSEPEAAGQVVREAAERLGGLDGLVHAAGVHSATPLRAMSATEVDRVFAVNVTAAFMLAKALRHRQVRRKGASIVLLSSAVGLVGQSGVSAYSASKGAVVSLAKSLAVELAREDVRVNCVCPGVVTTEMTEGLAATIGEVAFDSVARAHPLGLGEAVDVANAALYLLSPASRWVTGSALVVDGGFTAQ